MNKLINMKKKLQMLTKRELLIGVGCLFIGALMVFIYARAELSSNKKLTARILSNAIGSMEASQALAESCSEAYNTATACVSHLSTCNLNVESKKLDEFNTQKKMADQQINKMNYDMKQIIQEVSAKR